MKLGMGLALNRRHRTAGASPLAGAEFFIDGDDWDGVSGTLAPRYGSGDTTIIDGTQTGRLVTLNGTSSRLDLPVGALPALTTSSDTMVLVAFAKGVAGTGGRLYSAKDSATATVAGLDVQLNTSTARVRVADGTTTAFRDIALTYDGTPEVILIHFDGPADEFSAYSVTAGAWTTTAYASSGTPAVVTAPRIGVQANSLASYSAFGFMAYGWWNGLSRSDAEAIAATYGSETL